jgi:hypothetical protein
MTNPVIKAVMDHPYITAAGVGVVILFTMMRSPASSESGGGGGTTIIRSGPSDAAVAANQETMAARIAATAQVTLAKLTLASQTALAKLQIAANIKNSEAAAAAAKAAAELSASTQISLAQIMASINADDNDTEETLGTMNMGGQYLTNALGMLFANGGDLEDLMTPGLLDALGGLFGQDIPITFLPGSSDDDDDDDPPPDDDDDDDTTKYIWHRWRSSDGSQRGYIRAANPGGGGIPVGDGNYVSLYIIYGGPATGLVATEDVPAVVKAALTLSF